MRQFATAAFPSRYALVAALLAGAMLHPGHARAQEIEDNAALQSADAFGQQVGNEATGLYSVEEVRGFDPVEAGNARIEGLYFDQVDRLPARLTDSSSIKVGLSAERYAFPAPTGLVDHRLTKPGGEVFTRLDIDSGEFFGPIMVFEYAAPIDGERLAMTGSLGGRVRPRPEGGNQQQRFFHVGLRWNPAGGTELMVFGGGIRTRDAEARPIIFPAGSFVPSRMKRQKDLSQPWADSSDLISILGAVGQLPLGPVRIEGGIFRHRIDHRWTFADLNTGVTPDQAVASRTIIADADNLEQSLSGELRVVGDLRTGSFLHTVSASARGRHKERLFGGAQRIALGPSTLVERDVRPQPTFRPGLNSHDDVQQLTGGFAYNLRWAGGINLDAGLSHTTYRKAVDFADPLVSDPVTRDSPLLWNISASVPILAGVRAFASASRGMEEAPVAPEIAANRSEAPPAIRTSQEEGGVRVTIGGVSLVAGYFNIAKPYFNLDPARQYRQLGTLAVKGIELSLAGQILPGLTVVAGNVFLDGRISGEAVASGLIGERPIGLERRRTAVNLDWRLAGGTSPWSFDLAIEGVASRIADAANSFSAPGYTTLGLGARYRFSVGETAFVLRPRIDNALDAYGWQVTDSGGFLYISGRTAQVRLTADF